MRYIMLFGLVVTLLLSGCSRTNTGEDIYEQEAVNNESVEGETKEEAEMDTENDTEVVREEAAVAEYRKITPEEAKEMMTEGNMILDVRTQQEYKEGHIAEAVLIPHDIILAGDLERLPDKDQTILVYCRSGNRSGQAARALVDAGYTAVYDFGGINDWPYEVEQ